MPISKWHVNDARKDCTYRTRVITTRGYYYFEAF